jgi:hypothetical protein
MTCEAILSSEHHQREAGEREVQADGPRSCFCDRQAPLWLGLSSYLHRRVSSGAVTGPVPQSSQKSHGIDPLDSPLRESRVAALLATVSPG